MQIACLHGLKIIQWRRKINDDDFENAVYNKTMFINLQASILRTRFKMYKQEYHLILKIQQFSFEYFSIQISPHFLNILFDLVLICWFFFWFSFNIFIEFLYLFCFWFWIIFFGISFMSYCFHWLKHDFFSVIFWVDGFLLILLIECFIFKLP